MKIKKTPVGGGYWRGTQTVGNSVYRAEIEKVSSSAFAWEVRESARFSTSLIAQGTAKSLEAAKAAINKAMKG